MAADAPGGPAPRRPSTGAGKVLLLLACGWAVMLLHAGWIVGNDGPRQARVRVLVNSLDLTDMAWFNEARYTRHPGLADGFAAFQDGPGVPEHFPSGALVPAPRRTPTPSRMPVPTAAPKRSDG